MANGNGDKVQMSWSVVLPVGALTLLGSLVLVVVKDVGVALDLAKKNSEEILVVERRLESLDEEIKDRTQLRYNSKQAESDHRYILGQIESIREDFKEHKELHRDNKK